MKTNTFRYFLLSHCRYCRTCIYLAASRTLAVDSRRHYQHEMLDAADNVIGKCDV